MARSYSLEALVIKRVNTGETDRVVTLLSREKGRFVCVAKGVRKLNSSKRAYMEPGNIIKAHLVKTKSLPLLIQAKLVSSAASSKVTLGSIRQLTQILEIFDKLFVEEELPDLTYNLTLEIRNKVVSRQFTRDIMQARLGKLISLLGFVHPSQTNHPSILDYVQEISERPMRSFKFLEINN